MVSKKNNPSQDEAGKTFDPMAVRWMEKYDKHLTVLWKKLPPGVGSVIGALATFLVGISIGGDWSNVFVHFRKQFGFDNQKPFIVSNDTKDWTQLTLKDLYLENVGIFILFSCVTSYVTYFGVGGFLHWYYYVRQRDKSEEWKCQPNKWLSPELERHEILYGASVLFLNSIVGGVTAAYASNGGFRRVYYKIDEYGYTWFYLQFLVWFLYQDYATYCIHRLYHLPFLYRNFHKAHHKYKQPTAFSVTAIHPVESVNIQLLLMVTPLVLFPVHWVPFYTVIFYNYYHGLLDHSGINFKAQWWQPWQAPTLFHDNHHQYFHVNFGFNLLLWDYLHGTLRRKDRVYTEDIFYGHGKAIQEVSASELAADLEERNSENPLSYVSNKNENKLTKRELKNLRKKR